MWWSFWHKEPDGSPDVSDCLTVEAQKFLNKKKEEK